MMGTHGSLGVKYREQISDVIGLLKLTCQYLEYV